MSKSPFTILFFFITKTGRSAAQRRTTQLFSLVRLIAFRKRLGASQPVLQNISKMNCKQAKSISLEEILRRLGVEPTRRVKKGTELFYISPIREGDTTPSFKVDTEMNAWYAHGLGRGGNVLDFVLEYLQYKGQVVNPGIGDALHFLDNLFGSEQPIQVAKISSNKVKEKEPVIEVQSVRELHHPALLNYLKERGIEDMNIARRYVKQVHYRYKDKKRFQSFFAIGLENRSGGFALRNRIWKQACSPNDFSVITGDPVSERRVSVFEGMMDFLGFLVLEKQDAAQRNRPLGDVIVLNSLSFIQPAADYITSQGYRVVHTFLDNDSSGQKATRMLQDELSSKGAIVIAQNAFYEEYHDINDFLMGQLKK